MSSPIAEGDRDIYKGMYMERAYRHNKALIINGLSTFFSIYMMDIMNE